MTQVVDTVYAFLLPWFPSPPLCKFKSHPPNFQDLHFALKGDADAAADAAFGIVVVVVVGKDEWVSDTCCNKNAIGFLTYVHLSYDSEFFKIKRKLGGPWIRGHSSNLWRLFFGPLLNVLFLFGLIWRLLFKKWKLWNESERKKILKSNFALFATFYFQTHQNQSLKSNKKFMWHFDDTFS